MYHDQHTLTAAEIEGRWRIQNPFLAELNASEVAFSVASFAHTPTTNHAVFYLHGFGGRLTDTPYLEDCICDRHRLVRMSLFGLDRINFRLALATFGDVCAQIHNSAQAVSAIATRLNLDSFDVVAHSWGGMVAAVAGLKDTRCRKAMLLVSSPDICDVLENMHQQHGLPGTAVFDLLVGPSLRWEAVSAKFGKSAYQEAWEQISPFRPRANRALEMLIFNRCEDRIMRRGNVEYFERYAREHRLATVKAEFIEIPESPHHDMPLDRFSARLRKFLFQ